MIVFKSPAIRLNFRTDDNRKKFTFISPSLTVKFSYNSIHSINIDLTEALRPFLILYHLLPRLYLLSIQHKMKNDVLYHIHGCFVLIKYISGLGFRMHGNRMYKYRNLFCVFIVSGDLQPIGMFRMK